MATIITRETGATAKGSPLTNLELDTNFINLNTNKAEKDGSNATGTWAISISGSALTLTTGRTIGMTGDVTWTSPAFNGSADVTAVATLANSGVTAGTYGNATNIPQLTVDAKGRITSVTNTAVSIPSGSLTFTGDVTGTGTTGASTALTLANSGVTAGAYGSASAIPIITVDAKGRVTALSTAALDLSTKLNLSGGTMTGAITFAAGQTWPTFNQNTTGSAATLTTARTLTIGSTGKTFNGSADVSWSLAEIGAASLTHDHQGLLHRNSNITDFNNVLTEGTYGAGSGTSLTNAPYTGGIYGKLVVTVNDGGTHNNSNNWIWQIFDDTGGRRYSRYKVNAGAWTGWVHESTGSAWQGSATTLATARTLTIGSTGKTFNGSADVSWSLAEIGAYAATNPNGYTTNTGTVTSVSGSGSVAGISLSGSVTTSGSLSLSGTLSASIDNITDEHRLFNNMGDNHSTRTSFDAQGAAATVNFGWRYVQGTTNAPNVGNTGHNQYYSLYVGLGNDYAYNQYGMQVAVPRGSTTPYLSLRFQEGGAFGAWQKISAGYADSAGNADTLDGNHASAFYLASNPNGYTANTGTVTSVSGTGTASGLTLSGTVTSSGSLTLSGTVNALAAGTYGISISGNAATASAVSGLTLTSSANGINPDNVTQNQIGYNTSVSLFGQSDGGLYSSAYSSAWIHQIYGDFRTGQVAVRGKNSGTWQAWRTLLDSSNYTSYVPSLTGSGASGTWGINISGNAATATNADTLDGQHGSYYQPASTAITTSNIGSQSVNYAASAGSASSAGYLPTSYIGGQQLNPQTYFNNSVGLKVAMTAAAGVWSDTLWINGYSGGDVLSMCALHTQRNGTPRMYISSQNSNATSYGTLYEFLTAYNYTSYAPTLTGSGASGTWGINVTGSSGSCSGNAATATSTQQFMSQSHAGTYYLVNNWDGSRWNVTSNHGAAVRVGYSDTSGNASYSYNYTQGFNNNWNSDFQDAPAGSMISRGDTSTGSGTNGPGGTWWFQQNFRHINPSNYWGVQVAWGWEDNANILRTRNVQGGSYGSWVTYLNSANYSSYNSFGQVYATDWFRSYNATGWYNQTYAVGIYATEAGNVRTYNGANFIAAGNLTANSDERLKENWRSMPVDFVAQLAGVKCGIYDRIDTEFAKTQVGVSAQSLQNVMPNAIIEDSEGILSVAYGNAALVSAVELAKDNVDLRARIERLESIIETLLNKELT